MYGTCIKRTEQAYEKKLQDLIKLYYLIEYNLKVHLSNLIRMTKGIKP